MFGNNVFSIVSDDDKRRDDDFLDEMIFHEIMLLQKKDEIERLSFLAESEDEKSEVKELIDEHNELLSHIGPAYRSVKMLDKSDYLPDDDDFDDKDDFDDSDDDLFSFDSDSFDSDIISDFE